MTNDDFIELILDELVEWDIPGITKSLAQSFVHTCIVCLEKQKHDSGVSLTVYEESRPRTIKLYWEQEINDQIRRTWNDLQEATENGATGLAILLMLKRTQYTVLERSPKGTGFDYWLLDKETVLSSEFVEFRNARLEVSGILNAEKESIIKSRIKDKLSQVAPSDYTNLPALIVVVEFGSPEAHMVWKHE
jgi:hypothetical protein